MLHLDKTVTRKVPLHYNEDAENHARWQAMSFTEKREIVWHLQQRRQQLSALCEVGRRQDLDRSAMIAKSADSVN